MGGENVILGKAVDAVLDALEKKGYELKGYGRLPGTGECRELRYKQYLVQVQVSVVPIEEAKDAGAEQ